MSGLLKFPVRCYFYANIPMKRLSTFYILLFIMFRGQAREAGNSNAAVPEHGFLPGKEFKYYPPVDHWRH